MHITILSKVSIIMVIELYMTETKIQADTIITNYCIAKGKI